VTTAKGRSPLLWSVTRARTASASTIRPVGMSPRRRRIASCTRHASPYRPLLHTTRAGYARWDAVPGTRRWRRGQRRALPAFRPAGDPLHGGSEQFSRPSAASTSRICWTVSPARLIAAQMLMAARRCCRSSWGGITSASMRLLIPTSSGTYLRPVLCGGHSEFLVAAVGDGATGLNVLPKSTE
jgi:hypothetical protein